MKTPAELESRRSGPEWYDPWRRNRNQTLHRFPLCRPTAFSHSLDAEDGDDVELSRLAPGDYFGEGGCSPAAARWGPSARSPSPSSTRSGSKPLPSSCATGRALPTRSHDAVAPGQSRDAWQRRRGRCGRDTLRFLAGISYIAHPSAVRSAARLNRSTCAEKRRLLSVAYRRALRRRD